MAMIICGFFIENCRPINLGETEGGGMLRDESWADVFYWMSMTVEEPTLSECTRYRTVLFQSSGGQ